jgi:hypothetical protein
MKNTIAKFAVPVIAVLTAASVHAQTVNMSLETDYTSWAAETGFTATVPGGDGNIVSDDLIGIYAFQINSIKPSGSVTISTPFYTTCMSPSGNLNWNTPDNYNLQTFAGADGGINPNGLWANPAGAPLAGIQNANYLFTQQAGTLDGGSTLGGAYVGSVQDQGAAMALAMYAALYNSAGYGTVNANGPFQVTGWGNNNVETDYNLDINTALKAYSGSSLATGYLLTPTPDEYNSGAGQAMILLGDGVPQGDPSVPEPATIPLRRVAPAPVWGERPSHPAQEPRGVI